MATSFAETRVQPRSPRTMLTDPGEPPPAGSTALLHRAAGRLIVDRRDIEFTDIGKGQVAIDITVTNQGEGPSAETLARVMSATLGAFVPWRPLAVLRIPGLEPGQSTILRTVAQRVIPIPLGDPDRVPPAQLLTALGLVDDDNTGANGLRARKGPGHGRSPWRPASLFQAPSKGTQSQLQDLPPSPFDLLFGPSTYWAGNLNIFIGRRAVERHRAMALRILPEHTNVVMFIVGDRPDSYRFDLSGVDSTWETALFDPGSALSFVSGLREGRVIDRNVWIPLRRSSLMLLALRPPARAVEANVEIHVTQFSTQQTAVVEFSLDAQAAGPGCYVVG
jgi:hypothetical protein